MSVKGQFTALFESDPTTLTDDQFKSLITELRRRRNSFLAEEAAAAAKGKAARPKADRQSAASAAVLAKPTGELALGDLFDD